MSAFTASEDRQGQVLFGDTYYHSAQVALVPADSAIEDLSDLENGILGAGLGTTGQTAAETLSSDITLVTTNVGLPMLSAGQLDAYICDIGVAQNAVATGQFKMIEEPIIEEKVSMVFNIESQALCDELNESLAEFMATEEYTDLLEEYGLN